MSQDSIDDFKTEEIETVAIHAATALHRVRELIEQKDVAGALRALKSFDASIAALNADDDRAFFTRERRIARAEIRVLQIANPLRIQSLNFEGLGQLEKELEHVLGIVLEPGSPHPLLEQDIRLRLHAVVTARLSKTTLEYLDVPHRDDAVILRVLREDESNLRNSGRAVFPDNNDYVI
jgi:hypothetical protein